MFNMITSTIYTDSKGEYLQNNPSWHTEDSNWKAGQILKMLDRNNVRPQTVTEVGCGAGEILVQLASKLPSSVKFQGLEVSPDAYAFCKNRESENISFKLSGINEFDGYSDLLLVIDVFEHVDDYIGFIKSCKSKAQLKLFHIPLDISVLALLRGHLLRTRQNVGHIHYFTKATALATIKDCGYNIKDFFYTPASVELSRTFKSKLAKVPRSLLYKIKEDMAANLLGGYSLMVLAE
jgi:hypothetical protein